jgi:hypothetical protein
VLARTCEEEVVQRASRNRGVHIGGTGREIRLDACALHEFEDVAHEHVEVESELGVLRSLRVERASQCGGSQRSGGSRWGSARS